MRPLTPYAARRRKSHALPIYVCLKRLIATVLSGVAGWVRLPHAGRGDHIPANVRSIAVPVFATHAQAYHSEMALTQAVVRELNTRTRYRVLTSAPDDADAVLRGTVLTQTAVPLTYDSSRGRPRAIW